ncbi:OmpA family protein [Aquimarina intermedia]|uniref:OmpA family protein n=1 Tax=Aquimarina intermedia TaxID=350814 RepID=A0A5S5BYZ0_9FLAO|nr:OmpA family protein [Aquimarina intermedia]TYP70893.1 OmpA family protein [Aquimarina intermedia]
MTVPKPSFYTVFCTVLLCVFTIAFTHAQNLIPNPGFESTKPSVTKLTHEMQNFGKIKDWSALVNSPDIFHPETARVNFKHKANNFLPQFGRQEPRTGEGKVGMYISGGIYKEGIVAKLDQPLKAGRFYYYHMYVSLAEGVSKGCTSSIGSYFSSRKPRITPTSKLKLHVESTEMLCDYQGWTKVCGVYKAKGTENYISLGYFGNNPKGRSLKSASGDMGNAYYFVDDVMLLEMQVTQNLIPQDVCSMVLDFKDIEFLNGESETDSVVEKELDTYIQYVKLFKVDAIKVSGFANDAGSEFENEIMASTRALNVKKYFIDKGIDESLIEIVTAEEEDAMQTADPEAYNRVEVEIVAPK